MAATVAYLVTMLSPKGIFHLLVIYVVWGSTYLAIRVAVLNGFPPFIMAAMRVFAAALILLGIAGIAKKKFRMTRRQLAILSVSALLLWVGGNAVVGWAELYVDSGYAALLVACMPIWVALMEALIDRRRPTTALLLSLFIGLTGIAVLNGPTLLSGGVGDLAAAGALIFAGFSWGLGSIIQRRNPVPVDPEVSSGYQQAIGGVGLLIMVALLGEPTPTPTSAGWLAWGYLAIFGSVLAFTSFVKALSLLPTSIVMTYAYVNPVIAVFLGWLVLGEPVTPWMLAGATLVILGVAGVFRDRRREHYARLEVAERPPTTARPAPEVS